MDNGQGAMPTATPGETPTPATEAVTADAATHTPTPETPTADPREAEMDALRKQIKTLNAENATRRKSAESAEAASLAEQGKFKELYEKAEAARIAAETSTAQVVRERLVERIAAEYKLPAGMHNRLRGDSEEELRLDAAEVAGLMVIPDPPAAKPVTPNLDPNSSGGVVAGEMSDARIAEVKRMFRM